MEDADALGEGDKRVIVRLRRQPGVVTAPGVAEGENVCDADVAGVEGPQLLGPGQCVGSGRSRDQAPTAGDDFHARYRLVAGVMFGRAADEDALIRGHMSYLPSTPGRVTSNFLRSSSASFSVW